MLQDSSVKKQFVGEVAASVYLTNRIKVFILFSNSFGGVETKNGLLLGIVFLLFQIYFHD
jgi:hypothetical protein